MRIIRFLVGAFVDLVAQSPPELHHSRLWARHCMVESAEEDGVDLIGQLRCSFWRKRASEGQNRVGHTIACVLVVDEARCKCGQGKSVI